ncbi:Ankyrin repeats (3 copies) [Veillonella rodentium]|uniref:Ankyrin repeats (3 copies) n=1 Tax=Veillonella rodentium TaxID=248315 RepID=A0A239YTT8_9FIRM|nr:Ankyrin repeats (3 copies) [Veillonella rodentium]
MCSFTSIQWLIEHGVELNDKENPSFLLAVRYGTKNIIEYVVEHGADVIITEKDGMRPYSIAIEKGDMEMAEYFKNLELTEYHDLQNKIDQLKPLKLPRALVLFLKGDHLYFELPDSDFISIEFFPLIDTIPFKVGCRNLLRLSKELGEYDHW